MADVRDPGETTREEREELVAQLATVTAERDALRALRPRDPYRTGHRCVCCGREGAPDEDGLCPWCDGDLAREQELETLRARLHRARDVVEQIPMYLGATWWGQQLRAALVSPVAEILAPGEPTRAELVAQLAAVTAAVATARREGAEAMQAACAALRGACGRIRDPRPPPRRAEAAVTRPALHRAIAGLEEVSRG